MKLIRLLCTRVPRGTKNRSHCYQIGLDLNGSHGLGFKIGLDLIIYTLKILIFSSQGTR